MTTDFGKDIACSDSLKTGRYSRGSRLVAESCYRRLKTPRGTLRGGEAEQNFGLDLTRLVGSVSTKADAASLPGQIESELTKDERVESVDVDVLDTTANGLTSFQIQIEAQTSEGPFTLAIAVSAVSIELLGIKAEG